MNLFVIFPELTTTEKEAHSADDMLSQGDVETFVLSRHDNATQALFRHTPIFNTLENQDHNHAPRIVSGV